MKNVMEYKEKAVVLTLNTDVTVSGVITEINENIISFGSVIDVEFGEYKSIKDVDDLKSDMNDYKYDRIYTSNKIKNILKTLKGDANRHAKHYIDAAFEELNDECYGAAFYELLEVYEYCEQSYLTDELYKAAYEMDKYNKKIADNQRAILELKHEQMQYNRHKQKMV